MLRSRQSHLVGLGGYEGFKPYHGVWERVKRSNSLGGARLSTQLKERAMHRHLPVLGRPMSDIGDDIALANNADVIPQTVRYERVWDHYHHIIDWRYKMMTRAFGVWAGLALACGWLSSHALVGVIPLVGAMGAAASLLAWLMERRTAAIIASCEQEGVFLEEASGQSGLFARLLRCGHALPYDTILPRLYIAGSGAWLMGTTLLWFAH